MGTLKVVWRSMTQRRLATTLTIMSVALGGALVIAISMLKAQAERQFTKSTTGYELIVGARGNALNLVLSTMYHLDYPPGEIPYSYCRELAGDHRVRSAVPLALEGHFKDYTLVGTIPGFFTDFEYKPGHATAIAAGEAFSGDWQAVIGAEVAKATELDVGRIFRARQGIHAEAVETSRKTDRIKVVGVLEKTDTPFDRGIYVSLPTIQKIREFYAEEERIRRENLGEPVGEAPTIAKPVGNDPIATVTAMFIKAKAIQYAVGIQTRVSNEQVAQAVFPVDVIRDLLHYIGSINYALLAIAFVVIIVAGVSILVSIYNSMNDRKHDIAVMRALGARRATIFKIVVLEAVTICVLGGLAGILVGHGIVAAGAGQLAKLVHITVSGLYFSPAELLLVVFLGVLGAFAGLIPAKSAYDADVVTNLTLAY